MDDIGTFIRNWDAYIFGIIMVILLARGDLIWRWRLTQIRNEQAATQELVKESIQLNRETLTKLEQTKRKALRLTMLQTFNEDELRNLCFDLGVVWENLAGETTSSKVRELILVMERHGRLIELVEAASATRPTIANMWFGEAR